MYLLSFIKSNLLSVLSVLSTSNLYLLLSMSNLKVKVKTFQTESPRVREINFFNTYLMTSHNLFPSSDGTT